MQAVHTRRMLEKISKKNNKNISLNIKFSLASCCLKAEGNQLIKLKQIILKFIRQMLTQYISRKIKIYVIYTMIYLEK